MDHECKRCGCTISVFWHRLSYGCNAEGDWGQVFELCDDCVMKLARWMDEVREGE